MLQQSVLTSLLPNGIKWDFSAEEGFAVLSMGLNITWGYQHFKFAGRGAGNWLGAEVSPQAIRASRSCRHL